MSASYTEGRPSLQWGNGRLGGGPNFETRPHAQVPHHLAYLVALSVLGGRTDPATPFLYLRHLRTKTSQIRRWWTTFIRALNHLQSLSCDFQQFPISTPILGKRKSHRDEYFSNGLKRGNHQLVMDDLPIIYSERLQNRNLPFQWRRF